MPALHNVLRLMLMTVFLNLPEVAAQDAVKLVFPPKQGGSKSTLSFDPGQKVPLQWTCTFPMFTLQVWQGPDDEGTRAFRSLLTNVTDTTVRSLSWTAETLAGFSTAVPMHIRVFNPENKDCDTCNVQSEDFFITDAAGDGTPSEATTSNSTTQSASSASKGTSSSLSFALGIGLGLGIPIAAAVTSILTFCILRPRWREAEIRTADPYEASLTAWKQPLPSSDPPSAGYYGPEPQKAEAGRQGPGTAELEPDRMRVEADRDAERMELDGTAVQSTLSRKFSWQR